MFSEDELQDRLGKISSKDLEHAKKKFNLYGFITDDELPFSRVLYNEAKKDMLKTLSGAGFRGDLDMIGCYLSGLGNIYAVFDRKLYNYSTAIEKIKAGNYDHWDTLD